jgi:hypothetical protein
MDRNMANTFDNRTYPLNLGKCWHAMVKSTPQEDADSSSSSSSAEDSYASIAVLVRDDGNQQKVKMN